MLSLIHICTEDRIQVSIDWNKVPSGEKVTGFIEFSSGMQKERVLVSVFNPKTPVRDELQGLFIEENGYVSLPATASVSYTHLFELSEAVIL